LQFVCTRNFDFYCVLAHDSRPFLLSTLLMLLIHSLLKMKFWIFLLVRYWIMCCEWYALHSAWWWTALWPCPRPFPLVWPCETNIYQHLTHMVVQVPGISAGNDQCTTGLICPTLAWHQMLYPSYPTFPGSCAIGSAVHWLFATKNIAFGITFTWLWLPLLMKNRVQYILLSCFTHGSSQVPLLILL